VPSQSLRQTKPPVTVRACARPAPADFGAEARCRHSAQVLSLARSVPYQSQGMSGGKQIWSPTESVAGSLMAIAGNAAQEVPPVMLTRNLRRSAPRTARTRSAFILAAHGRSLLGISNTPAALAAWLMLSCVVLGGCATSGGVHSITPERELPSSAQTPPPSPDGFIEVDEEPVRLSIDPPVYPEDARGAGIEGTVLVRVLVGRHGSVDQAMVVDGPQALAGAALNCARSARFRPARKDREIIEVWVNMPVIFRLR
jgi:TonB family protein